MSLLKPYRSRIYSHFLSLCNHGNIPCKILGIETSCDDTGCGIVDSNRQILGESFKSQQHIVLQHGGVFPVIAHDLHKDCIKVVVNNALRAADMTVNDVDAIAVTVKPGLALPLIVGMNYGKALSMAFKKPYIPIHHMQAHALTSRLIDKSIQYPFLTLLISGGHCILGLVLSVEKFLELGSSLDNGPGEAFDKVARRMKLRNLPQYRNLSGGQTIEDLAKHGDCTAYQYNDSLSKYRNCDFAFCGLKQRTMEYIESDEKTYDISADAIIPTAKDLCASFLFAVTKHLCRRVQRAIYFVDYKELLPEGNKTLVVSGGVACNSFIRRGLSIVCNEFGYHLSIPPPKLCTDNGIMIAWNGVERYQNGIGLYSFEQLDEIDIEPRCPLGEDYRKLVSIEQIKPRWIKLDKLRKSDCDNDEEISQVTKHFSDDNNSAVSVR